LKSILIAFWSDPEPKQSTCPGPFRQQPLPHFPHVRLSTDRAANSDRKNFAPEKNPSDVGYAFIFEESASRPKLRAGPLAT
jgi:hypothetical protein